MGINHPWPETDLQYLKDNWIKLPTIAIANHVGRTKNAVIGRAHRLGLPNLKQIQDRPAIPKPARPGVPVQRRNPFQAHKYREPLENAPTGNFRATEPASAPATLLQLNKNTCRYPLGEELKPAVLFCGSRPLPGFPYCAKCCRLAYQPPRPR